MVGKQVIAGFVAAILAGCVLPLAAHTQAPSPGAPPASAPDDAEAQSYVLDIPRLPIIDALKEFTTQTGLQVSFWPDAQTDQSMLVGPLRGRFTVELALTRLLSTSGLAFRRTNERSLVVMAPSLLGAPRNGGTVADQERSRLAEGEPYSQRRNQPPSQSLAAAASSGSAAIDGGLVGEPLDEVIVTGSRIERSGEGPAPVQVFTRRTIDALGAASIPDVLRYIPQQPFNRAEHYYYNAAQYSQMRGIGVDTTLILINGRRVVPTSNSLTVNAFDLNSIPLAAVDRIEVLSDSASAVYGADAMGGVVNVVLKKEIPQPVLDVQYGEASGGAQMLRTSLSAGYSTDRLRSSLIFDVYSREFLLGEQRDRWRNQDFTRFGGTDYRSASGSPGTVRTVTGGNLPGLATSFARVPDGSTGIDLTPEDFAATAGTRNRTSTLSTLSIVPEVQQRSVALFSEYDLTLGATAFAEVLYTNRETVSQDEIYSVQNAQVPATNPFNPFGQAVLVDFLLDGIEPRRFVHDLELLRGAAGLRGSFGSSWRWEITAAASTETDDALGTNQISAARVGAALAATDTAGALNPFVDGPAGSPELLASLIEPNIHHHFSRGRQLSAFMRGELLELPAGPLQAVIGGEWRDEAIVYDDLTQAVDRSRDVSATFTELRIPLIAGATRGDTLSMTVAARVDDYSDFGSTVNPQFGLMWRPANDILLRGSYGTSFRPPSLFELHALRTTVTNFALRDPARNDALSNVTFLAGGNPDLQPIEAQSMTAGLVLTPSALPGLRLLGNYWSIQTENRVTLLHFSSLLANEQMFSDRVVRDLPTPADIAAGIPGRLLQLDISRLNFGRLSTNGVDVDASYAIATRWGEFTPRLSATWVNQFTAIDVPTTRPVDRVGIAHPSGSIPRWRVVGSLGWKRNGVGLSTTIDWLPGYMDATTSGVTGRRLPSRTLVDMQASFAMDELFGASALWDDLSLQAGVKNAFDELPPFADIGFAIGFDSSQGELIGRFGYLRLSKGF
ncbi:MAG: TonB-dependent receptor [Pseudomonadota bacterium]|nr:TonB-dependent receptor [Pseudomonadota bacterium]